LLPKPESVTFVSSKKIRSPVRRSDDAPAGAEAETMNAPNSPPGERDLDALRRAQRAHEPSMEEILASIRSIIADDREPVAARSGPKPDAAPSGPQIVYSKDAPSPARAAEPPPPAEPPTPKVVWSQPQPQAAAPASAPKPEPASALEEAAPLLSDQADQAVSAAFDALSTSLALQSSELAENVAREILRPLLKAWLDENLPSMVERLVRAEIQRVARGGR
jgi:cell pole-organizing protein PopZ